jgi:hypothetical protein
MNSAGQSKSACPRRPPVQDEADAPAYRCGGSGSRNVASDSAVACPQPGLSGFLKTPVKGENDMTTSSARALLLGAAIAAGMGIGYAIGAQPHMTASIALLQSARGELAAATPNKGGHRERALGLIDQAISEVRAGIAFAGS